MYNGDIREELDITYCGLDYQIIFSSDAIDPEDFLIEDIYLKPKGKYNFINLTDPILCNKDFIEFCNNQVREALPWLRGTFNPPYFMEAIE